MSQGRLTTAAWDKKPGALPAGFTVYFTLGLALFQQDSCDDVAEHMVGGVPELGDLCVHEVSLEGRNDDEVNERERRGDDDRQRETEPGADAPKRVHVSRKR